jgi:hypothetical protein
MCYHNNVFVYAVVLVVARQRMCDIATREEAVKNPIPFKEMGLCEQVLLD